MTEDTDLLRRYVESGSEQAFAELVRRRIDLVYSVAFRCTRDRQRAEDVAQAVFVALARKAAQLTDRPVIVGWLYRSTQLAARDVIRSESRRFVREQEAYTMDQIARETPDPDWNEARPVLDEVLSGLNDADRDAVLLRFVEARSFSEIGATLRLTENAARMRVDRALEKMRRALARKGITSSAAAIVTGLGSPAAVIAAPAGLATSVASAAVAGAAAAPTATGLAAIFMSTSKVHLAITAVVVAAGTAGLVQQLRVADDLRREVASLRTANAAMAPVDADLAALRETSAQAAKLRAESGELAALRAEIATLRERSNRLTAVTRTVYKPERRPSVPYTGTYFEESQVDVKATPISRPVPEYPSDLRKAETGGEVVLDVVVDEQGASRNVTVVSATHPEFAESALAAVSEWEYAPAKKAGKPVATHRRVPITFSMNPNTGSTGPKQNSTFVPWF